MPTETVAKAGMATGKTFDAIKNAPQGAVFVIGWDSPSRIRRIAAFLGREDLTLIKGYRVTPAVLGDTFREVVIDHSVTDSARKVCVDWVKETYLK